MQLQNKVYIHYYRINFDLKKKFVLKNLYMQVLAIIQTLIVCSRIKKSDKLIEKIKIYFKIILKMNFP